MPIKVVTGAQGSGKSLYSVVRVATRYFDFDENNDEYVPKEVQLADGRKVKPVIWSNIEGLKFPHINLDNYLRDNHLELEEFFCVDYAQKIMDLYGCNIFILDEVQRYFRKGKKSEVMAYWHEMHRHYGFDVYYQTQEYDKLSKDIVDPIEFEIRLPRRTFSLHPRLFKYKRLSDGVNCGSGRFIALPRHFALYKSSKSPEIVGGPRPLRNLIILFLIGAAITVWSIWSFMADFGKKAEAAKPVDPQSQSSSLSVVKPVSKRRAAASGTTTERRVTVQRKKPDSVETAAIQAGVFFVGDKLSHVQVLGKFYCLSEIPYSYTISGRAVTVHVPVSDIKASLARSSFVDSGSSVSSSDNIPLEMSDEEKYYNERHVTTSIGNASMRPASSRKRANL